MTRPLTTTITRPGEGRVAVDHPTAKSIRMALRHAGFTRDDITVNRAKGKRTTYTVTASPELLSHINNQLDWFVPFGIGRTYDGRNFTITLRSPRR